MTDTVPTGAFFVAATDGGTLSGAAGNGTGGTVTWNLGTVTAATSSGSNSLDRYVTLRYPTPTFTPAVGQLGDKQFGGLRDPGRCLNSDYPPHGIRHPYADDPNDPEYHQ